jgi:hypothetical protein
VVGIIATWLAVKIRDVLTGLMNKLTRKVTYLDRLVISSGMLVCTRVKLLCR